MNRVDTQEVKDFMLTDKWFALFYLVSSIVILTACIVYIVNIAGPISWSHYYELPGKYQFWFVLSIILIIVTVIATIGLFLGICDDDFSRNAIVCDTNYNYYVSGRKVSKKEYDEEKTKYNDLIAPFIESLKSKKDI